MAEVQKNYSKGKQYFPKKQEDVTRLKTAENLKLVREIFRENEGKTISGADFGNKLKEKKPKELWEVKEKITAGLVKVFDGILVQHWTSTTDSYLEFKEEEYQKFVKQMEAQSATDKNAAEFPKESKKEADTEAKQLVERYLASKETPEALRALLYAFTRKSASLSAAIPEESFRLEELQEYTYTEKNYLGNLAETFKFILCFEEYHTIDICGQVIQKLCKLTEDAAITCLEYNSWTEENISNKPEYRVIENCLADFQNAHAWSLLTKYYHEIKVNSVRDAGNLFEKIKFPEDDTVQTYALTTLERSLERVTSYLSSPNFLLNQRYHLESTEENPSRKLAERTSKFWKEYVDKIRKSNCFVTAPSHVAFSYYDYACAKIPMESKANYDSTGEVTYTILEQRRKDVHALLERYQPGCRLERYLFRAYEKGAGKYRHSTELFRFMVICLLRNRDTEEENGEIAQKVQYLYQKCDASKFDTAFGIMFTKLGELLRDKEGSIKPEALRLMVERFPKAPKVVQLYMAYEVDVKGMSVSYLNFLAFCHSIYEGNFDFYKELYMALRNYLGGTFDMEATPERDSLRGRILDMLLQAAKKYMDMYKSIGKGSFDDRLRFYRMIYALLELCNTPEKEAEVLREQVRNLANAEEKKQLLQYELALHNLLKEENMTEELRKQIVLCGITNYWDRFVENLPQVPVAPEGKNKKTAALRFNEYLKQIDYRAFRRCVLQKMAERASENDRRGMLAYKLSPYFCDKDNQPTAVLLSSCRHIGEAVSNSDEVLISVLAKALEKNCKNWEVLESYIPGFYADQDEEMQKAVTEMLVALISSIYNADDMVKLLHSMACSKNKAQYALRLLGEGEDNYQSSGLENELDAFCLDYYRTVAYAVTGQTEQAQRVFDTKLCGSEDPDHSRMLDKLQKTVINKMYRDNFQADDRVLKYGLQENELLKLGFMEPVKAETNLYALLKQFLREDIAAEEKCLLAPQIYYWLLYSEETLGGLSYQEFLLRWAYCELESRESEQDKLYIIEELMDKAEKGQLLPDEQKETNAYQSKLAIFNTLSEKLALVLDEARITMPMRQEKLTAWEIKIAGWNLNEVEKLYLALGRKCDAPEQLQKTILEILKQNLSREAQLQQELAVYTEQSPLAKNILHALYIRGNSGLEFTVLNREDETEHTLFYQVKNISGHAMGQIGLLIQTRKDGQLVTAGDYTIQSLETEEMTYGACPLDGGNASDCMVLIYDGTPERVLCSFDAGLLCQEKSSLEEIENASVEKVQRMLGINLRSGRHTFLVYDYKKVLGSCIRETAAGVTLDFSGEAVLDENTVARQLQEVPEGSLVFWTSYWQDVNKNWTEETWNGFYRYEDRNISLVFCYFSQEELPKEKEMWVNSMGKYVRLASLKPAWKENFRRREVAYQTGSEVILLDETIACLETCARGNVGVATQYVTMLQEQWTSKRRYIYPSDVLSIAGSSGIAEAAATEETKCTALRLMPNASAKDMIGDFATYLKDFGLSTNELEAYLVNAGLISARTEQVTNYIGEVNQIQSGGTYKKDMIAAGGTKIENNIQVVNYVQQIFNEHMYAKSAEEQQQYEDLLQEYEDLRQEYEELKGQQKSCEASTDQEELDSLREKLEEKEQELELLRKEKEDAAQQSITDLLKDKLQHLVKAITAEDKRIALFPEVSEAAYEVLLKDMKDAGMEENFEHATFVHFLFWFLSELTGAEQGQEELDFAPVNLMYAKMYESLLKKKHFDVYKNKIPNCETRVVESKETINGRTVNHYYTFGTLPDTGELTIGSFSAPLNNTNINLLSRGDAAVRASWRKHKEALNNIKNIRNDSLHGTIAADKVEKASMERLVRTLMPDNSNVDEGAFVRLCNLAK